jgi:hypothetical protein
VILTFLRPTLSSHHMGYEYRLEFGVPSRAQADELLRGIAGFEGFSEEFQSYSFRRDSTDPMPDVTAAIEASGIYLCSYGGSMDIVKEIQAAFAAIGLRSELTEL